MARPRVLITGFGPFPGVPDNPSAWLAEMFAARPVGFDCELHARVLPTEWEAVALSQRLYETLQPHVMIHFGLNARAKTFRIEKSAHNRAARRADAKGALPPTCTISSAGPDRFDTSLPAASLAAHLRMRGLPAVTSRSAGRYLCNFLYYHSLDWARGRTETPLILFVHIPPLSGGAGPFREQTLLDGAREILRFALAFASKQEPAKAILGPAFAQGEARLNLRDA